MKNSGRHKTKPRIEIKNPVYIVTAVIVAVVFLAFMIVSNLVKPKTEEEYMFKKEGDLAISDSAGHAKIKIDVEIADNEFDRQLGLMFRRTMEESQGMLFAFPSSETRSFWMRNTYLPLDIVFIDSTRKIVAIHKNTVPLSDNEHHSIVPAQYVLEVNAGFTDKYNIKEGDRIQF